MGLGADIRQFLRDLFGSRLVERLEEDLLRVRQDFEERLQDKELLITTLRTEKAEMHAKIILYERSIMPTASRAGAEIIATQKPKTPSFALDFKQPPPVLTRWQQVQADHNKNLALEAEEEAARNREA